METFTTPRESVSPRFRHVDLAGGVTGLIAQGPGFHCIITQNDPAEAYDEEPLSYCIAYFHGEAEEEGAAGGDDPVWYDDCAAAPDHAAELAKFLAWADGRGWPTR